MANSIGHRIALMSVDWPSALIGGLVSSLGMIGTLLAGLLLHKRDNRRIDNEEKQLDAAAMSAHWNRLTTEVTRLDERVRSMEADLVKCHEERSSLEMELTRLRLTMIDRGNNRQTAQLVASTITAELREQRALDGVKPTGSQNPRGADPE